MARPAPGSPTARAATVVRGHQLWLTCGGDRTAEGQQDADTRMRAGSAPRRPAWPGRSYVRPDEAARASEPGRQLPPQRAQPRAMGTSSQLTTLEPRARLTADAS